MQAQNPHRRWQVMTDPAVVKILFDRAHRSRLAPFFAGERSVTEVAALLEEDPKRSFYYVQRYVRLGLLEYRRSEERWGKPVKYYAAAAEGFFVPIEHFPNPDLEATMNDLYVPLLMEFNKQLAKAVWRHLEGAWGRRFHLDAYGNLIPEGGPPPGGEEYDIFSFYERESFPPVWTWWQEVYLTHDEAKAVQAELIRLCQRLSQHEGEGRQRYLIRTGMTPID